MASSKTDEKKPRKGVLSKIPGTMELNEMSQSNPKKSFLESSAKEEPRKEILLKERKQVLVTPQKTKRGSKKREKTEEKGESVGVSSEKVRKKAEVDLKGSYFLLTKRRENGKRAEFSDKKRVSEEVELSVWRVRDARFSSN